MEILFLIAFATTVLGGIVGWFSRLRRTIYICLIAPFLFLVADVVFQSHSGWTEDTWVGALFLTLFPFYFFWALPCLGGGVLMNRVRYHCKRRAKI
ncbi:MAG: hypothetical protein ACREDQ_01745 [Limisphaerales bacterium]